MLLSVADKSTALEPVHEGTNEALQASFDFIPELAAVTAAPVVAPVRGST